MFAILNSLKDYAAAIFGGRNYFSQRLETFTNDLDGLIDGYKKTGIGQVDPGSINITLEMLVMGVRKGIDMMEAGLQEDMETPQKGFVIGEGTRQEIYRYEEAKIHASAIQARKKSYGHLTTRLSEIGEGYTLLKKLGSTNPLADLRVNALDYIDGKISKVFALMRKGMESEHAMGYHLAEIFMIGNDLGIEVSGIQGLREAVGGYMQNAGLGTPTEEKVRTLISRLQKLASEGKLDPKSFVIYKG